METWKKQKQRQVVKNKKVKSEKKDKTPDEPVMTCLFREAGSEGLWVASLNLQPPASLLGDEMVMSTLSISCHSLSHSLPLSSCLSAETREAECSRSRRLCWF
jgi:hypothetical protein